MSDSLIGTILGVPDGSPPAKAEAPAKDDATAALATDMAMKIAATDPEVAKKAAEFLEAHIQLLHLKQLEAPEEWALRRGQMKGGAKEAKVRRLGQLIRVGLQVITAGFGGVLAIFVIGILFAASTSRNLVITAFDTPPALAGQGVSGKVVASAMLDAIAQIQDASRSASSKRDVSSAWTGSVDVVVPQTGMSISELNRLLRDKLGQDTHISGDLVQMADGNLVMTVRGDGIRAGSFSGRREDLADLTRRAAEHAFGEAEPALYSSYLVANDRAADADSFLTANFARAPDDLKARLANNWAFALETLGRIDEAIAKYRLSLKLAPDNWVAQGNFIGVLAAYESEEAGLQSYRNMLALVRERKRGPKPRGIDELNGYALVQDATSQVSVMQSAGAGGNGMILDGASGILADAMGRLYDWSGADNVVAAYVLDGEPLLAIQNLNRSREAIEKGQFARAVPFAEAAFATWQGDTMMQINHPDMACEVARAYGLNGQAEQAAAIFADHSRWVKCASYQADSLQASGDHAAADAAYARAVAMGPSLPYAYHRWGLALLARGDAVRAQEKFKAAHERGPRWADPLKGWGDSLMAQRQSPLAAIRYDQALALAPNWSELRQARARIRS